MCVNVHSIPPEFSVTVDGDIIILLMLLTIKDETKAVPPNNNKKIIIHFKLVSLFEVEAVVKEEIVEVTETSLGCKHNCGIIFPLMIS